MPDEDQPRPARDSYKAALCTDLSAGGIYTLFGDLDYSVCEELTQFFIMASASYLEQGVTLYVSSEGGDADPARAVVSMMEMAKAEKLKITTVGLGSVLSAGLDIFMAGTRGRRFAHADTLFMSHATQTETNRKEAKLRGRLDELFLKRYTRIKKPQRERMLETGDWYFGASEAVQLGVADRIIQLGETLPK